MKPVLVTGIKPTGEIHLGNYFGSIKPVLDLKDTHEIKVFVADYHALTTMIGEGDALRGNTWNMLFSLHALGIRGEGMTLFRQSGVPLVTEVAWLLGTVTPLALLQRGHAVKSQKNITHGIFSYPVLMAADILTFGADLVPVGKDQMQHLEIARTLAANYNRKVGYSVFKIPEAHYALMDLVVPGIDGQKMSKSYGNTIPIFAEEKEIRKLCAKIVTDSAGEKDQKDPDTSVIFQLYSLMASDLEIEKMREDFLGGAYGYGVAKRLLADKILEYFADARKVYNDIRDDSGHFEDLLGRNAEHMRILGVERLCEARGTTGLWKSVPIELYATHIYRDESERIKTLEGIIEGYEDLAKKMVQTKKDLESEVAELRRQLYGGE